MIIRKHQSSDKPLIVECMKRFGDYLVNIDPIKRTRRMPGFGERFTNKMLEKVNKNNGFILIVENEGQIIGFIAGIILRQTKQDLLEGIPSKDGRIIELFIEEDFREQGVGKRLMSMIEEYFRESGCNVSRVDVFKPNTKAYRFYRKLGYQDRNIDMMKIL